ncbi:MAG: MarR family transcriptional regulator [Comamonadaceae bacterium]|nr:MAG: MarR family transcriptional regulator [Comamonadaceae bacterium]
MRKLPRTSTKDAAGAPPKATMIGHGGVIDLHAYAAPQTLRISQMEEYFGYLVRRLDNKIHASFLRALADEDITPARFTALSIIGANPGVRQVDIARALDIARPAALKLVNQLVDLGLVDTHPIPSDKRIGALALSEKGQARLADYENAVRDHETAICARISADEREQLTQLLRKLLGL